MIRIVFLLFLTTFVLPGCVAYKVNLDDSAYTYRSQNDVVVTEKYDGIPHCGFAYITIISAGIIPNGCDRMIVASSAEVPEETEIGTVSYLQGWITLLLTPFSSWSYQSYEDFGEEIAEEIRNGK